MLLQNLCRCKRAGNMPAVNVYLMHYYVLHFVDSRKLAHHRYLETGKGIEFALTFIKIIGIQLKYLFSNCCLKRNNLETENNKELFTIFSFPRMAGRAS